MKKLKYIISIQKGKVPKEIVTSNDGDLPVYLSMDYLRERPKKIYYVTDYENSLLVDDNEILLLWDGSNAGEFIWSKKGVLSSTMAVIRPKIKINKKFLFYRFKDIERYLKDITVGMGIPHVDPQEFLNFSFYIPSLNEQTKIASFLDRKTAQIDELIAKKERLLELYKEEKNAIINQAVIKGINPNVKLKDSGIPWLGEIPEHWNVKKLKYVGKFINGYSFNSDEFITYGVRVLKISNIQHMKIDWTDASFIDEAYYDKLPNFRVFKNDLVFALTRPIISTGIKAAIVDIDEKILINQRNSIFRTKKIETKWIYYILLCSQFINEFDMRIDKTGQQPNISSNDIGDISIPVPDKKEQVSIIAYIEKETARIDAKIKKTKKLIELLKEYKTALISEVVTGKIKII